MGRQFKRAADPAGGLGFGHIRKNQSSGDEAANQQGGDCGSEERTSAVNRRHGVAPWP
nr:hypothetical protein SHINE37_90021 [Rhizobiaceae bacterium]